MTDAQPFDRGCPTGYAAFKDDLERKERQRAEDRAALSASVSTPPVDRTEEESAELKARLARLDTQHTKGA